MGLEKLLEETHEAYYWMGFLFADGHFRYQDGRGGGIQVAISKYDREHIEKYAKFIKYDISKIREDTKYNTVLVRKGDVKNCKLLMNKFNIKQQKSTNPHHLPKNNNDDLIYAFIIGYIDGDGCIQVQGGKKSGRSDPILTINIHHSWQNFLNQIVDFLYKDVSFAKPKVIVYDYLSYKYAKINIANNTILQKLKQKTIDLQIPAMDRKWSRIDMNRSSRNETGINNREKVMSLYSTGLYTHQQISEQVGIARSYVSRIIKWCKEGKSNSRLASGCYEVYNEEIAHKCGIGTENPLTVPMPPDYSLGKELGATVREDLRYSNWEDEVHES